MCSHSSADRWKQCAPPHPRGEVQLTLHLPSRRQEELRLSASDSEVNPRPPLRRRLIRPNGGDDPGEEADGAGRCADGRGDERREASRRGKVRVFDPGLVFGPPRHSPPLPSPSAAVALTCPSLAGSRAVVQLLLLPPRNNRNLQK